MSDQQAVVRAFIEAFNARDLERIMGFLSEDCVYHNIPVQPVQGPDAIRAVLQGYMGMASKVDWVLHAIAESDDGVVLTERLDRFLIADKWVELPVMGAFQLRGEQIVAWRDYFDMNQFQSQLAG